MNVLQIYDLYHAAAVRVSYAGCHNGVADFAEEFTIDTTEIPESHAYYIDYDKMGCDMVMSGNVFTIETAHDQVHIFWSH